MAADEEDLLEQWAGGDERAGNKLFKRYFDAVYRFHMNKVSNEQQAEDLVQRTFMRLVRVRSNFRGTSFRAFVFGVAQNVLREYYRSVRRTMSKEISFEELRVADLQAGPVTILARQSDSRRLLLALRRLPIEAQTLVELHYFEKLTGRELAEVMNTNENTIRSRLRAARERLLNEFQTLPAHPSLKSTLDDIDAWAERVRASLSKAAPQD